MMRSPRAASRRYAGIIEKMPSSDINGKIRGEITCIPQNPSGRSSKLDAMRRFDKAMFLDAKPKLVIEKQVPATCRGPARLR